MNRDNPHTKLLLKKCKTGNKKAQFAIYKNYYKAMYNCAYRIMNDSFEAEDIMQEAFLAAFKKLDTYSGEVTFGAWLKRIVVNKCLSNLKKINKIEMVALDKIPLEKFTNEGTEIVNGDVSNILKQIKRLKTNYRIALSLNLIEGYDYEEIAQIMEISYANSRTTVSRAKQKLRELLLPIYEE